MTTTYEAPITLEVPGSGTLENVPAEWIDPEDGGPVTLHRVWLGNLPVYRYDVGWIVGLQELSRQERIADVLRAETRDAEARDHAQGRKWAEAAE